MDLVREHINFERGGDPLDRMDIGNITQRKIDKIKPTMQEGVNKIIEEFKIQKPKVSEAERVNETEDDYYWIRFRGVEDDFNVLRYKISYFPNWRVYMTKPGYFELLIDAYNKPSKTYMDIRREGWNINNLSALMDQIKVEIAAEIRKTQKFQQSLGIRQNLSRK